VFSEKLLTFTKYYKSTYVIDPEGEIRTLENNPYEVEHNGHLYTDIYQGEWHITGDEVSMVNGVAVKTTNGSWQMRLVKEDKEE